MQISVQEQIKLSPAIGSSLNSLPLPCPQSCHKAPLHVTKNHRRGCFLSRNRVAEATKPPWERRGFSILRLAETSIPKPRPCSSTGLEGRRKGKNRNYRFVKWNFLSRKGEKSAKLGLQQTAKENYSEIQTNAHDSEEVCCLTWKGSLKDEDVGLPWWSSG